jgi:hypothetical protein
MIVKIIDCARCGKFHRGIKFKKFTRPLQEAVLKGFTHFAICPKTKEPILLKKQA